MNKDQRKTLSDLKNTDGWRMISDYAYGIIKRCSLDNVNENLPANEYKIECLARKKAIGMFKEIFEDAKPLNKNIDKSKIDYS